jgi:hypothetical protein
MKDRESPVKQQLRESLAKMGEYANSAVRKAAEDAIANIDDTDPKAIRDRLPQPVLKFYQDCAVRGLELAQHARRARDQGFHIETIIVCHGLIQYALRGLYVLAWQRSRESPLTEDELRPFWDHNDRRASVRKLIPALVDSDLLIETQGPLLVQVNAIRNRAAHGVVFGEIPLDQIAGLSEKVQWAAVGALKRMQGWFSNPRPLKRKLGDT